MAQLFHRDLGGAGKPPLVLLHGMLGSSRNWQSAGRDLTSGFHVLALDLRNHGASPHAPEMDYDALSADVVRWMDEHQLGEVAMMGHSMGGKTAMLLACRHAARVSRLIVVDIAPKAYFWPAHRAEFAAMHSLDLANLASRSAAEDSWSAAIPSLGMRKFLATNLERDADGRWRWAVNLPVLAAALPALEANPLRAGDRFGGPALFIAGGRSLYVSAHDGEAIRRHFPAARIEAIAAAGHNPHVEARAEFVAFVNSFAAERF